jgi:hypothetical protein
MKKLFLSIALPSMVLVSFAQINKGNTLLGGNLGFNFQQYSNPNTNSNGSNTNIQPFIQFAYKANRTIGFGFDFSYQSNSSNDGQFKTQQFGLSPSVNLTQYHPIKGNFGWWLQQRVGAGFYNSNQVNGSTEVKNKSNSVFANITPGIYYAAGEKKQWLLQASVGGLGGSFTKTDESEAWGVYTNLFQYYQFGFAYIFRKG